MTECKYQRGRMVPISYSKDEKAMHFETDRFTVYQILEGCVILYINGETFYVSRDHILLFPRNTAIEILASHNLCAQSISFSPEFININLNWQLIESFDYILRAKDLHYPSFELFYNHTTLYKGIIPISGQSSAEISNVFEQIILQLTVQPDAYWSCRTRSIILELFYTLTNTYKKLFDGNPHKTTLEYNVLDYIDSHITDSISLSALCKYFNTNRTTLCTKFKSLTGKGIIEYLIEKRIELSKQALAFTNLSIAEISRKYSFQEPSYFIRVFKKHTGTTPTTYRKNILTKRPAKQNNA